jgi:acyl-CoA thioesterase-1
MLIVVLLLTIFAPPSSAQPVKKNILVFGDSLSAGYRISYDASWVSLLQKELARSYPDFNVVNASISGETTEKGLRRISEVLQQHHPAIVVLELGAVDALYGSSLSAVQNNLSDIIEQSRNAHANVLLLGMKLPRNYSTDYAEQFRTLYPTLAEKYKVTLVPFLLEGVEQFQRDNLHPTADAQPQILHNVIEFLQPLLL